jgi:phosphate starvation-inducible membrane PsiE
MSPYSAKAMNALSSPVRILIVAVIMVGLHLLVILVRRLSNKWMSSKVSAKLSKSRTIGSLTTSALIFLLYFSAFGIILSEFGVSLKAYLASASIMGLAIGFGSQGRVKTSSGKEFLRVKFRLWPGRGTPIETVFKQEVFYSLKALDPNYQDWMVTVNYEVERKIVSL